MPLCSAIAAPAMALSVVPNKQKSNLSWKVDSMSQPVLQDVQIAFQMFDLDDSNAIDRKEFHEVTAGLRQRMRKVSHLQRTGFSAG